MSLAQSTKKHDAGRIPGVWSCPSTLEIRLQSILPNGKLMFYKWFGVYSAPPPNMQTLCNTLFTNLTGQWTTNLAAYMHANTACQQLYIRDMALPTNQVFQVTPAPTAVAGTGGAAVAMPENAAIVMTASIASRGRGMKGRTYLGGWVQSADVTTGGISATVQTAINTFGTGIISVLNAQSLTASLAQAPRNAYMGVTGTSHVARGTPAAGGNPPQGTHVTVLSWYCRDLIWDTQRRRVQP
jgi:hypothetical protein